MVNEFDMPALDVDATYKTQIKKKKKKNPSLESENDSSEFAEGKNQSTQTSLYPVPFAGFICRFAKRNCSPLDKPTFIDPVE